MSKILHVRGTALSDTKQTQGMIRAVAFANNPIWVGSVEMEGGTVSGWHHHGNNDSYLYVVSGKARFEHGQEGQETVDATPGDYIFVPAHTIHREVNPGNERSEIVLFRIGGGEPVFNVSGPKS